MLIEIDVKKKFGLSYHAVQPDTIDIDAGRTAFHEVFAFGNMRLRMPTAMARSIFDEMLKLERSYADGRLIFETKPEPGESGPEKPEPIVVTVGMRKGWAVAWAEVPGESAGKSDLMVDVSGEGSFSAEARQRDAVAELCARICRRSALTRVSSIEFQRSKKLVPIEVLAAAGLT
jgi:hypothetical protein